MPEATVRLIVEFQLPFDPEYDEDATDTTDECIDLIERVLRYDKNATHIITVVDECEAEVHRCDRCGTIVEGEYDLQNIDQFYSGEQFCEKCVDRWHRIFDDSVHRHMSDAEDEAIDTFNKKEEL